MNHEVVQNEVDTLKQGSELLAVQVKSTQNESKKGIKDVADK